MSEREDLVLKSPILENAIPGFVKAVTESGEPNSATVVFESISAQGIGPCDVRRAALDHTRRFIPEPARSGVQTRIQDFFAARDVDLLFGPTEVTARPMRGG